MKISGHNFIIGEKTFLWGLMLDAHVEMENIVENWILNDEPLVDLYTECLFRENDAL